LRNKSKKSFTFKARWVFAVPVPDRAPPKDWRVPGVRGWKHGLYSAETPAELECVRELLTQKSRALEADESGLIGWPHRARNCGRSVVVAKPMSSMSESVHLVQATCSRVDLRLDDLPSVRGMVLPSRATSSLPGTAYHPENKQRHYDRGAAPFFEQKSRESTTFSQSDED
jgi:hypothetical protein